jgi:hypothetical protein
VGEESRLRSAALGPSRQMMCWSSASLGMRVPSVTRCDPWRVRWQNLPSIVVGHVLSPGPGSVVIDMCSAPGGKTSHIASLAGPGSLVVAVDRT